MQKLSTWQLINTLFLGLIALGAFVWLLQLHTFGIVMGMAGLCIAYFLWKYNRWAYFAAAIWCFGLLRIAMDDGHDFYGDYGSYFKIPFVIGIVIAIILHEKVAIKNKKPSSDDKNMPE